MRIDTADRRRVVLTFLDQAVSSLSNFGTGIVIARLSGAARFGDYVLTLLVWLLIVGLHRALVTEPMMIRGAADPDPSALVAHAARADMILGATAGVVVAVAGATFVAAESAVGSLLLALAPWIVALVVQDFWRATAFHQRRPASALANDLVFAVVQVVMILVFLALGWRSAEYIITAWGIGAAAGAWFGMRSSGASAAWRDGVRYLEKMWVVSRWLLADFVTTFSSDQAYLAFLAFLLVREEYGGVRAAMSLVGPLAVIFLVGGNVGLPESSRRNDPPGYVGLRQYARQLTIVTFACAGLYGATISVGSDAVLGALYGQEFVRFAPIVAYASLQYAVVVLVFGQGIALRAAGRTRLLWRVRLVVTVLSLATVWLAVHVFGTIGAGVAGVATGVYYCAGIQLVFWFELTRSAGTSQPSQRSTVFMRTPTK
jgi:O-antigen/teichoic acid export membrane protein